MNYWNYDFDNQIGQNRKAGNCPRKAYSNMVYCVHLLRKSVSSTDHFITFIVKSKLSIFPPNHFFCSFPHINKRQLHPSSCSKQKTWYHPSFLTFSHDPHLMYHQILLPLLSKYIQNITTSPHPFC